MTFSEKLKSIRKKAGMSQEKLAEKIGVSRQAITKWETDSVIPDIDNMMALSALFNISLDELLSNEKTEKKQTDYLYESVTEYDIDNLKRFDMNLGGANTFVLSGYVPIEDEKVLTLSCEESRSFLKKMNIDGEIIHTPGHSDDSISIILDAGIAIVGDLYTLDTITAYNDDILNGSWNKMLSRNIKKVYYGHAKEKNLCGVHSVDDFMRKDD